MQTAGATNQDEVRNNFFTAVLPAGWQMSTGFLERDLTTIPAYDSAGFAQFNIFRTSADDAFQQITWSARGQSTAQQIPEMVIWGGTTANTILGRRGQDNLIHGGQGDDRIVALGITDRIHGDDGFDTAVFRGNRSQYIVTRLAADGSLVEVRTRRGGDQARVATLSNVEALQFRDGVERTALPFKTLWWKFLGYEFTPAQAGGPTSRVMSGLVRRPGRT
jgi:Ca2+-binding RTX toxin-like protein